MASQPQPQPHVKPGEGGGGGGVVSGGEGKYGGPTKIFINNQFVESVSGKTFKTVNPASGQVIALVSEGDKKDIEAAVAAADAAFVKWKKVSGEGRAKLMLKLAALVEENVELLAETESMDNGMSIMVARGTVKGVALWLRYYAGLADKLHGTTVPLTNSNQLCYTQYEPLGVVGAVIPWNFPLSLCTWKLAPAIACGNTIVLKPSEKTPLSTLRLAELVVKAGFPPGVINVVPGYGPTAGDALARHMRVRKITFTGSVGTGRAVLKAAADSNLKKVTLELGGKSPIIVCEDCDLDEAAFFAHNGVFINQGQFCAAGSRVYVQDTVYDAFVAKAVELAKGRLSNVGDPRNESTELGPVVDDLQFSRVKGYIEKGVSEGAKLVFGGKAIARPGYYLEPTIFADVKDNMCIAKEEIFGPVQSIIKFSSLKDALANANNTEYGLAAGVFTKDVGTALALANELEAGIVWINTYGAVLPHTPFGGYKQSGIGRENGEAVLKEYLNLKTVVVQQSRL